VLLSENMKVYSVYYKKDDGSKTNEEVRAHNILAAVPMLAIRLRMNPASLVRNVWAIVDVEENKREPKDGDEPEEESCRR